MQLGLDLGTGLAKLARLEAPGGNGPYDGRRVLTVPAAVLYQGVTSEIPAAPDARHQPAGSVRCDGFPAMLVHDWSTSRISDWAGRTPVEVTQSFLRCLFGAGRKFDPRSDVLVVAAPPDVPPFSAGDARAAGTRERVLQDTLTALGLPPRRLIPAPVATLLHLQQRHEQLAAADRFVVCDVGAGSMSFSLCTAGHQGLRVADSVSVLGTTAWSDNTLTDAGVRPLTLVESLVTDLAGRAAAKVADAVSVRRWRDLERVLADRRVLPWLGTTLRQASANRQRHGGVTALQFADLEVTAVQLLDACRPVAERAGAALRRLFGRQADASWRRMAADADVPIVLTGGLSTLPPLRDALLLAAGHDPGQPGAAVEPQAADRLGAAASGAALAAAGAVSPGDRYPHSLRLAVHRIVGARLESRHILLVAADTIDLEQAETTVMTADGEPLLVTVPESPSPAPLPVEIIPHGHGSPRPAPLQPPQSTPPGRYRIGIRGSSDGLALLLHDADGTRAPLRYMLPEPSRPV